jgi:endo-1,4-beta-xylanase
MCSAVVTVEDTLPPSLTVSLTPNVLWPPNHKLVTVTATVEAIDGCDPSPAVRLVSIVSNEPDNGTGDGNTAGDIQGAALGTADFAFELRGERSGPGSGRSYTVTYEAEDASGNTTLAQAIVSVPHNP